MQTDLLPDFLRLKHAFESRPSALLRLLSAFGGDPSLILRSPPTALRDAGCTERAIAAIRSCQAPAVDRDLAWAGGERHHLVCYDDDVYPPKLAQIPDFPLLLYVVGDAELLSLAQVAIVGSRLCTPGGTKNAFDFAAALAGCGLAVTSGLALGIDAEAHRGALSAGGSTLAVTATGPDIVYPQANRALDRQIREHGLIVTEFPPGRGARRASFPRRNRIISGLSLATLVVEAAERSGSLITARLAGEQGRDVFAIPGSIHNPLSRGCHGLIRDGAMLAESVDDILAELGIESLPGADTGPAGDAAGLDREQRRLLDAVGYDPVGCDRIVERSGLTIDQVSSMLLILELNDLIRSAPGGRYVRT